MKQSTKANDVGETKQSWNTGKNRAEVCLMGPSGTRIHVAWLRCDTSPIIGKYGWGAEI